MALWASSKLHSCETEFIIACVFSQDISPDDLKDELPERQPRYPLMIVPSLWSSIHGSLGPCFSSHSARYPFSRCIPSPLNVTSLTARTFIIYSYKYHHDDGRISYPLCFIFSSPAGKNGRPAGFCTCGASLWLTWVFPAGCRPEQQMMYAGSKNKLVHTVQLTKVREFGIIVKIFSDSGRTDEPSLALVTSDCFIFDTKCWKNLTLVFSAGVWDQKHGGPDGGVAQGETRLLRLNAVSVGGLGRR